jgi:hypothetical protein
MSDPNTPALAAAVPGGALVMALLGVEPQALIYGAVGAFVGFVLVAQIGRLKAAAVFVPVVLLCALLGTLVAAQWFNGSALVRNAASAVLGLVFQPLLSAFVSSIQARLDGFLNRMGMKP